MAVTVLIGWAALANLDEVTRGEGKVIPSRQVQILQSMDGGMVSEILVKEGQSVKVGDLLLKVDPTVWCRHYVRTGRSTWPCWLKQQDYKHLPTESDSALHQRLSARLPIFESGTQSV